MFHKRVKILRKNFNLDKRDAISFLICILLLQSSYFCFGQDIIQQKTIIGTSSADTVRRDSTRIQEAAPLDIADDRGLYIRTTDGKIQLRILGSVRYLVVFDGLNLSSKNSFRTDEIPTGALNKAFPNYYNGLDQTRLGFEVTRKTDKGDVFIRLETDFAGDNGFRIRHSYGQFDQFLFGQTWSLFSHVNALPAMVDFSGPTGSIIARTPQLRYSVPKTFFGANVAVGLEYIIPNLTVPDSIAGQTFQLFPDITMRLDKVYPWGSVQLSGIIPMLSGRSFEDQLILKPGWGISGSTVVNSWKNGKWYLQGVIGQAITRYFNDLSGIGSDVVIDPDGEIKSPLSVGLYGTYEHSWRQNIYSNFTAGWLHLQTYGFTEDFAYKKGYSFRVNTFWDLTEGAKIGGEAIWGNRVDNDRQKGNALRLNILFYYDF
ncbi:hypothetical protein DFQ04_1106 [Algoriphagus boseongensis]|uniref:Porin-like protein n=1 Tax=Algoriphagus boseongensis TaxID=1442587 RepID=A0A4R6TC60_9BACT|nr:DcaP family trimeric outer membrane transporter [Algoriphagus boseongensis]TDQ19285.1 hypothetical protein DFQ04_1106 [Algoriphagus boseongensis]